MSTNESDQTVSQSKTIHNGTVVPLPSERRGRIPAHTGSDLCVLTLDRTLPTETTTAEDTARCIHQHFGRWGTADRPRTDNGPAFANDLLKGLANLLRSTLGKRVSENYRNLSEF